jgi:tetratricopeptide (TPR) repeat protein
MALINRSLLHRTPAGRYQVHELLRQYAEEKLDQSPTAGKATRDRHSAYYAAALQRWEADLKGPRQKMALAEMGVEIENARAAWDWAAERQQMGQLDQMLEGLCEFYWAHWRLHEGEAACRMAAEQLAATAAGDGLRLLARILARQADFGRVTESRTELVNQLLRQSLAILEGPELAGQDTRAEKAFVLLQMGQAAGVRDSDYERAQPLLEQSLALYQAVGDRWWASLLLSRLSGIAQALGAYDEAKQLAEESLTIARALGDQTQVAGSLSDSGFSALSLGQLEEAERLLRESVAIYREMASQGYIATGLCNAGLALCLLGKLDEARSLLEESLAIFSDLGIRWYIAGTNVRLGYTKMHLGQYKQARAQAQMSLAFSREYGEQWLIGSSLFTLGSVALAEQACAEAWQLLEESIAVSREIGYRENVARALAVLGYAARGLGHLDQAGLHLHKVLETAVEGDFVALLMALPAAALLLADRGQEERAVELYALASRYPFVANSRWFEDVAGKHIAAVAATLPPEVVAAARERGRARDLEAMVAELLAELEE